MDKKLLSILACPVCHGALEYHRDQAELHCRPDGLAFPVREEIPVLLEKEARTLSTDERLKR